MSVLKSISNAVKSVEKGAGTVLKASVAPVAVAASASLNAVGARNLANKVVDKTAVSKSAAKFEKKAANVSGWAIDAGAAAFAGAAVAPAVGHAAAATGSVLAKGGVALKAAGGTVLKSVTGFFSKGGGGSSGTTALDTTATDSSGNTLGGALNKGINSLRQFASSKGQSLLQRANRQLSPDQASENPNNPTMTEAGVGGGFSSIPWWVWALGVAAFVLFGALEKRGK